MHKLLPVLVLFATVAGPSLACAADLRPGATAKPENPVRLAGGMGGGTGGMDGAGMGGMGGGMTGGGIGGMGRMGAGMGGMGPGIGGMGAAGGYGFSPGGGFGRTDTATDPGGGGAQPAEYYQCVTPYDRCSLAASPGSMHRGSACTCSTGHTGKIK